MLLNEFTGSNFEYIYMCNSYGNSKFLTVNSNFKGTGDYTINST